MSLRDFIKPKSDSPLDDPDYIEEAVAAFERNTEKYPSKSLAWNVRITAEDLNIRTSDLLTILDKHYGTEEKD